MEKITNDMIDNCLFFLKEHKGHVSRYSFDSFVTKNIKISESFNIMPRKLLREGLISVEREGNETWVTLTSKGINKLKNREK